MAVTATWCAIAVGAVAWEVAVRTRHLRFASALQAVGRLWSRPLGRVALLALWLFVGIHVFARDTPHG